MMENKFYGWIGTGFTAVFTAIQTEHLFQIISLILTIICTFITGVYTIYKLIKEAKSDGKITKEEAKKIVEVAFDKVDDVVESVNNTKEEIEKFKGNKEIK